MAGGRAVAYVDTPQATFMMESGITAKLRAHIAFLMEISSKARGKMAGARARLLFDTSMAASTMGVGNTARKKGAE